MLKTYYFLGLILSALQTKVERIIITLIKLMKIFGHKYYFPISKLQTLGFQLLPSNGKESIQKFNSISYNLFYQDDAMWFFFLIKFKHSFKFSNFPHVHHASHV